MVALKAPGATTNLDKILKNMGLQDLPSRGAEEACLNRYKGAAWQ
jgi:hypothetical protein